MKFRENMASLTVLSDDYYQNRMTFSDYREKRNDLLRLIDEELNGIEYRDKKCLENEIKEESFVDKALSFFKIDKHRETNKF